MNIKHFYIKTENGGVICAAAHRPGNGTVHVGFSFCSPKDTFVKKFGRQIAEGRMLKRPIKISGDRSSYAVAEILVRAMEDNVSRRAYKIPHWVPKSIDLEY